MFGTFYFAQPWFADSNLRVSTFIGTSGGRNRVRYNQEQQRTIKFLIEDEDGKRSIHEKLLIENIKRIVIGVTEPKNKEVKFLVKVGRKEWVF